MKAIEHYEKLLDEWVEAEYNYALFLVKKDKKKLKKALNHYKNVGNIGIKLIRKIKDKEIQRKIQDYVQKSTSKVKKHSRALRFGEHVRFGSNMNWRLSNISADYTPGGYRGSFGSNYLWPTARFQSPFVPDSSVPPYYSNPNANTTYKASFGSNNIRPLSDIMSPFSRI
jgi:hypothetical protein